MFLKIKKISARNLSGGADTQNFSHTLPGADTQSSSHTLHPPNILLFLPY